MEGIRDRIRRAARGPTRAGLSGSSRTPRRSPGRSARADRGQARFAVGRGFGFGGALVGGGGGGDDGLDRGDPQELGELGVNGLAELAKGQVVRVVSERVLDLDADLLDAEEQ